MAKPFHHPAIEQITLTGILHALSDPIRRQMVVRLLETKTLNCSSSACNVLPPSTLSFHFCVLRECGLVFSEKNGTSVHNTLRRKEVESRFPGLLRAILKHHQPLLGIKPPPPAAKAKKGSRR